MDFRNEYAILHLFEQDGTYVETRHWLCGTSKRVSYQVVNAKLEEMIAELGDVEYCDIEVELFQTTIDGEIFGLIPDKEYGFINLEPNSSIAFGAPWDGSYSS